MKNNQDKLNDALGMVDEATVQSAMLHAEGMRTAHLSRRALLRRRVAVVVAACLALTLMVGAILAVPLLTADEPAGTDEPANVTHTPPVEEFYVNAPIVKLTQLSATEAAEISDLSKPIEKVDVQMDHVYDGFHTTHVLTFDCEPGETVTIHANTECLGLINYPYDRDAVYNDREVEKAHFCLRHRPLTLYIEGYEYTFYETTQTLDPSAAYIVLSIPNTDPANDLVEEVLTFTVENEEGQITGAGSLYVGKKFLFNAEEQGQVSKNRNFNVTRSSVLGSVRFTDPAAVTEEQVNELLDSFAANAETAKAELDYSPVTANEFYDSVYVKMAREVFHGQRIMGNRALHNLAWDYYFISFQVEGSKEYRQFIVFKDGTWAELESVLADGSHFRCNGGSECPNTEKLDGHGFDFGCVLTTLDGRVYRLEEYDYTEEKTNYTAILIHDPNA